MQRPRTNVALVDRLLERFIGAGFSVEPIPGDPSRVMRPRGYAVTLRIGDATGEATGRTTLSAEIELRGDLALGGLRRWRIGRSVPAVGGSAPWDLTALITLNGDISMAFLVAEGRSCADLLLSLIADVGAVLGELPVVPPAATATDGPEIIIELRGVGELASGRSGLTQRPDRRPEVTIAQRDARIAICDWLVAEEAPTSPIAICHDLLAPVRRALRVASGIGQQRRPAAAAPPRSS